MAQGLALREAFDLAVIGAGVVGLAHALAAARLGKSVAVFERDPAANGASIRNFGFVTVTGQERGECWRRARRSRDVWAEIAPRAGIDIEHRGLLMAARSPAAAAVLEEFLATEMGEGCALLAPAEARERLPFLREGALEAALFSPHDLRVESVSAIPKLAAYLRDHWGVRFFYEHEVVAVEPPAIETRRGRFAAAAAVICPGEDFRGLARARLEQLGLTKCRLAMLRVRPAAPARLGCAVMSDLGLARYKGYADLAAARALREELARDKAEALAHGVHLIVTQSADGSLIVGDSHHYADPPPPFVEARTEELILDELDAVLDVGGRKVIERWSGVYASAPDRLMLRRDLAPSVKIVIVTSGTGASTAFAIGEETIAELFRRDV